MFRFKEGFNEGNESAAAGVAELSICEESTVLLYVFKGVHAGCVKQFRNDVDIDCLDIVFTFTSIADSHKSLSPEWLGWLTDTQITRK